MKLKRLDSYVDFMEAVQGCEGEVYYDSSEGDHLNLRSTFCQYLFAAICGDWEFFAQGEIICEKEGDYGRLEAFLVRGDSVPPPEMREETEAI